MPMMESRVQIPHPYGSEVERRTQFQARAVRCLRDGAVDGCRAIPPSPGPAPPFPTNIVETSRWYLHAGSSKRLDEPSSPESRSAVSRRTEARSFGRSCAVLASERSCSALSSDHESERFRMGFEQTIWGYVPCRSDTAAVTYSGRRADRFRCGCPGLDARDLDDTIGRVLRLRL